MANTNPKVDAYITKSADFAQPILEHLRELVHKGCPEVEEKIKWGMPFLDYKGALCSMASFKQHAVFAFWKASLMKDPKNILQARKIDGGSAMGHFGKVTSIKDLPSDKVILDFIKQAKNLNDQGIKVQAKPKAEKKELVVPAYFTNAIRKDKKTLTTFIAFAPSHKKEYVEWITEAKTKVTRDKRMKTVIEWMAEGKGRNWKYQK